MGKISAIFDRLINILAYVAAFLIILMMLSIAAEAIVRKLLGVSIAGVIDFNEHFLLYTTFLGATWLLKKDGHVKLEMLLDSVGPRAQAVINIVASILGVMVCLTLVWFGTRTTWDQFQRGIYTMTIIETPVAPLIAIIPIGAFLLAIQFMRRTYGYFAKWGAVTGHRGKVEEEVTL